MGSRAVRDAVAMPLMRMLRGSCGRISLSSVFLKNGGSSSLIGNQSPASSGFVRSIYVLRCRQATTQYSNSVGRANPKWQWSACERTQMLYESQSLAPKSSLFSSVASPELSGKDSNPDSPVEDSVVANGDEKAEPVSPKQPDSEGKNKAVNGGKAEPNKTTQRKETYSDTDTDEDEGEENELSTEELFQLVRQKEELLKAKHKEIEKMQEKVLRSYAEIENVMDRTRREAENSKKFAIQSFAKSLLDVADNLGRASSVVKESFSKIDASKDTDKAVPLLKTLLEGVEMTEKQLSEVFKKYGIERFDPINEHFDPHRHMAVFQVPDATKQPGTVAVVLKPGYTLHDRVIRPAEVGVVGDVQGEAGGSPGPST